MLELYKNIKKIRLKRHLTQTDLALKVGYSDKSMIAKIEKGQIDLPHSKIEQFAEVLGVPPCDLMGWTEEPTELNPSDLSPESLAIARAYDQAPEAMKDAVSKLLDVKRDILIETGQGVSAS